MKKIISINLGGRVIPIEDSAYEKLQSYIDSLRRYFSAEEGRDEIINDIESRIAELMAEKVRRGSAAITDADVEEIEVSIGRPQDFENDDNETAGAGQAQEKTYQQSGRSTTGRRLYRNSRDKFAGGVCSGIANYLNADPAIVRLLFVIITFGGFGFGFLAYILLWIFLPEQALEGFSGKRLFRNPDDRILGGVAGGLAAYFNARLSVVRLIFCAPIILSILFSLLRNLGGHHGFPFFPNVLSGSLSGTFILAYIVFWIVLPEANSPYEKMEMRGEKVDLNSIRQNVVEGMAPVKDRLKNWGEEVKESAGNMSNRAKEFASTRGRDFAHEIKTSPARNSIGHAIGVLFKAFFYFIAGTIALSLFLAMIALLLGGMAWWPINNFLWTDKWQPLYASGVLIFFLAVPFIGIIVWLVRRLMRVRSRRPYLGWTFTGLWLLGWVMVVCLGLSIAKDHREYRHVDYEVPLMQPAMGKMTVTVPEPELTYNGRYHWMNDEGNGFDLTSDTMKLSFVDLDFEKSSDSNYHVIVKRYSYGSTADDALQRASHINYTVTSIDSVLQLGSGYAFGAADKLRWQHVVLEIQVPEGKMIRLDASVHEKLNTGGFDQDSRKYRSSYHYQWREDRYDDEVDEVNDMNKVDRVDTANTVDQDVNDDVWYDRRGRRHHNRHSYLRSNRDYVMGSDGGLREVVGTVSR